MLCLERCPGYWNDGVADGSALCVEGYLACWNDVVADGPVPVVGLPRCGPQVLGAWDDMVAGLEVGSAVAIGGAVDIASAGLSGLVAVGLCG